MRRAGALLTPRHVLRLAGRLPLVCAPASAYRRTPLDQRFRPGPRGAQADCDPNRQIGPLVAHTVTIDRGTATRNGAVFDADLRFVRDAFHRYRDSTEWWRAFEAHGVIGEEHWPTEPPRSFPGTLAVLTASNQRYYFHWLLDVLPRLEILRAYRPEIRQIYVDRALPFQRESLATLGVTDERTVDAAEVGVATADELWVPCHQVRTGHLPPSWVLELLRRTFSRERRPGGARRRLLISRDRASKRRLTNEDELAAALAPHGYERVRLEDLSVSAQARAFADAESIVATHGSGLANLVFCQPGTRVLELFPGSRYDLFARIAASVGARHETILGVADGDVPSLHRDFVVDVRDVVRRARTA